MSEVDVLVGVLGPAVVAAPDEGGAAPSRTVRGPRQVGTLALLVAHRGRPVRRELIEDELWGGEAVSESAVRVNITRLRRLFDEVAGVNPISGTAAGYQLVLDRTGLDVERFGALAADAGTAAARGDAARTERLAADALALWRGRAYEGALDLDAVTADRVRLEEARRDVGELRARALLGLGRWSEAHALALALVDDDPYRERPWLLAMAALHAMGRTTDALRAHDRLVARLRTDLGVEPCAEVAALHAAIVERRSIDEVVARAGVDATPAPAPVAVPTRTGPVLVGRAPEHALLAELVEGTDTRIVVMEGPAGLGKTRLAAEAVARAHRRGLVAVTAACPREDGAGQLVLRHLVSGLLDPASGAAPELAVGGALIATFPDLVGAGPATDEAAVARSADPGADRLRVYAAMEQLVAAVPGALVVVDDAQWVDPSVAPLITHLATVAPHVRWLVLARTGERGAAAVALLGDMSRLGARWHELGPLDDAEAAELVRLHAPDVADDGVALVVAQGAGSPLLLGELAQHLARGGDPSAIPAGIDAVVAAELARLGPDVAAVAAALAVAGDPHPLRAVTAAAGLEGPAATRAVTALVSASLAATDAGRASVWPVHDLVRRALLAPLAHHEVSDLHRRLAGALATTPGADPKLVLRHLLDDDGADRDELERAAATALDDPSLYGAPHEVATLGARLVARAGEAGTTATAVATRLRVAQARYGLGDDAGGRRLVAAQEAAVARLDDPVLAALALVTRTNMGAFGGFTDDDVLGAEAVLDRLPEDEVALQVMLACWIGHAAYTASSSGGATARRLAARADALVTASADRLVDPSMARGQVVTLQLACSMAIDSPAGETDRLIDELGRIGAEGGDPTTVIAGRLGLVERAMRAGTVDDVVAAVDHAAALDTPLQRIESRWFVSACRAGADLMRGDLAAARTSHVEAMAVGAAHGVGLSLPAGLLQLFVLASATGRLAEHHGLVPEPTDDTPTEMALSRAFTCLSVGDVDGARRAADHAARPGGLATDVPGQWGVSVALAGQAAWAVGHAELGAAVAEALAGLPDRGLSSVGLCYLGSLSLARGLALLGAGDLDAALDDLDAAVAREGWVGAPITLGRAATAAADGRERRGRAGDEGEATRLRALAAEARARLTLPPDDA